MMTAEEHRRHLNGFEVDQLLKILALEASKFHNRCYSIVSSSDGYQVAFGALIEGEECREMQEERIPRFPTLKQAIIAALICGKTFQHYIDDAIPSVRECNMKELTRLQHMRASLYKKQLNLLCSYAHAIGWLLPSDLLREELTVIADCIQAVELQIAAYDPQEALFLDEVRP